MSGLLNEAALPVLWCRQCQTNTAFDVVESCAECRTERTRCRVCGEVEHVHGLCIHCSQFAAEDERLGGGGTPAADRTGLTGRNGLPPTPAVGTPASLTDAALAKLEQLRAAVDGLARLAAQPIALSSVELSRASGADHLRRPAGPLRTGGAAVSDAYRVATVTFTDGHQMLRLDGPVSVGAYWPLDHADEAQAACDRANSAWEKLLRTRREVEL